MYNNYVAVSLVTFPLLLLLFSRIIPASCFLCNACSVSGGSRGKLRPAPAAIPAACWKLATCCKLCKSAAECSWAFRRSSATLDERWSLLGEICDDSLDGSRDEPRPDSGLIGQQEHSPGKPETVDKLIYILISYWLRQFLIQTFHD